MFKHFNDKINFFRPDTPNGGGNNHEPFDSEKYDNDLARLFSLALLRNIPKTGTLEEQEILSMASQRIIERVESVNKMMPLIAPKLRPLAERIYNIPDATRRTEAALLAQCFRNYDLNPLD